MNNLCIFLWVVGICTAVVMAGVPYMVERPIGVVKRHSALGWLTLATFALVVLIRDLVA